MTPDGKRRLWTAVGIFALLNFTAFFVVAVLVGDALNGYVDNGHYYLWNKFRRPDVYFEVSRAVYTYLWWLATSALVSFPLVAVSSAMLSDSPPTVAELKADLKELPHAFTPLRLGIFARALWEAAGSHWRDLVPFWFAPTYCLFMWNLGSPIFGRVVTGSLLVPFPVFWAFIRSVRLFSRGDLTYSQALVWVMLMPLLVLFSLMPLLAPLLAPGTD
jgi:hypothetical protein